MQTRTLGSSGIELSEIALGTWGLASGSYGPVPRERFAATVREALERGVTTFDVAPLWGDGESERVLGEVLRERAKAREADGEVLPERASAREADGEVLPERANARDAGDDALPERAKARDAGDDALPERANARDASGEVLRERANARDASGEVLRERANARDASGRVLRERANAREADGERSEDRKGVERADDGVVIITRAGYERRDGQLVASFGSEAILASVESSLERLGRDRVDVLMLHDPPLATLQTDIWHEAVNQLIESGKIRAWGVAVGSIDEARLALKLGASAIGLVHHILEPHALYELAVGLKEAGAGAIVRSPLAYGLLAGRWPKEHVFADGDHRARRWSAEALARRYEQLEKVRFLAHGEVPDLATAALRFVLSNPFVATACVGARSPEQIAHAARASRPAPYLPPEDMGKLKPLLAR